MNRWGILAAYNLVGAIILLLCVPAVYGALFFALALVFITLSLAQARWRSEQTFTARMARQHGKEQA